MVAGGLPTGLLGTSAGPCSPGATGHPALVARRRHLNVNQKVYLSWCYRLQRDGAMAPSRMVHMHGAHCREGGAVAGRRVRWQGDQQVEWPLLALLHLGHVVPRLSVSSGLAE